MIDFVKRTTTIFLLLISLSLLYIHANNTTFIIFIYILSIYSFYEWNSITSKHIFFLPLFTVVISLVHYFDFINIYYLSVVILFVWIILLYSMIFISNKLKTFMRENSTIIGLLIFSSFFLLLINMYPYKVTLESDNNLIDNKHYILLLVALISSIDIFAYISGKLFGRTKIVSSISPKKTFEGYLGSYLLTVLFFILFFNINNFIWTYTDLFYLSAFIFLAFFGDLFMSFIKRVYNIKDTGTILPGHGGILDRLDSYLPVLPLFYLWFMS